MYSSTLILSEIRKIEEFRMRQRNFFSASDENEFCWQQSNIVGVYDNNDDNDDNDDNNDDDDNGI